MARLGLCVPMMSSRLVVVALVGALATGDARHALPAGNLIVGYQSWSTCNMTQTRTAVEAGVNVVIWFATNLASNAAGQPAVTGGPDYDCVAAVAAALADAGLNTTHLISIGGWDAPHPNTTWDGGTWFKAWRAWNEALPFPFAGFDWDLEGNDAVASPWNAFTEECVDVVVDMSEAAKRAGYVVSMVPAQSYLDESTSQFNLSLLNAYANFHPNFTYHGLNAYARILSKAERGTFDMVIVQLYESWSRADYAILDVGTPPATYLADWAASMIAGWTVDFPEGPTEVRVSQDQLVVGLSRGSADGKSAFFWPKDCGVAWSRADPAARPRGYAFWNIPDEGATVNGTNATLAFAPALNAFLQVRATS